jgi:glycerol kinase
MRAAFEDIAPKHAAWYNIPKTKLGGRQMKQYILSLDSGTTSSRAILFDSEGNTVAKSQNEFTQVYPEPGFVEHDPLEILYSEFRAIADVLAKSSVSPSDIACIGIANQRETTVVWEKATGRPVYNAIVWQCRRTAPICESLIKWGLDPVVGKKPAF